MCSSVFSKVMVLFHVHCSFQSLTLPPAALSLAATDLQGPQCAAGTVEAPHSLQQLVIPPLLGSRFFAVPRYVCLLSTAFLRFHSGQYSTLWVFDQAPYNQIPLFNLLYSKTTSSRSFYLK